MSIFVKRLIKWIQVSSLIFALAVVVVLIFVVGYSYYQTRNMRALVERVENTKGQWEDFSYDVYSHSFSHGYYQGKIWGPKNEFLYLGVMPFNTKADQVTFYQVNDISVV